MQYWSPTGGLIYVSAHQSSPFQLCEKDSCPALSMRLQSQNLYPCYDNYSLIVTVCMRGRCQFSQESLCSVSEGNLNGKTTKESGHDSPWPHLGGVALKALSLCPMVGNRAGNKKIRTSYFAILPVSTVRLTRGRGNQLPFFAARWLAGFGSKLSLQLLSREVGPISFFVFVFLLCTTGFNPYDKNSR